jgi:putative MFS transporter
MRILNGVVLVAAIGTFVDVVDLTLFTNVRVPSLRELGVPDAEVFHTGVMMLNLQLAGMFAGGVVWGALADRRGRKAVLFASILVYSLATLACAWVRSVPHYALARFICGFGLAGEFGAGVALISEILPPEKRGYGTTLCAAVGLSGAIAGGVMALALHWRTAYIVGGVAGLALLVMRARTFESGMFEKSRKSDSQRGMRALFGRVSVAWRYALSLAIALPLFFVLLAVVSFTPELAASLDPPLAFGAAGATTLVGCGLVIGDVITGLASQRMRSRKKPIQYCVGVIALALLFFLLGLVPSKGLLALVLFAAGLGAGYMVLFVTNAAEQFGTNVRGSASVLAPNAMRLCVIPMTLSLQTLAGTVGLRNGALIVGAVCVVFALLALRALPETFGRDLDFVE